MDFLRNKILSDALAPSSKQTYQRSILTYAKFVFETYKSVEFFPLQAGILMNFITYLRYQNYAQSTIATYTSALSFFSKLWDQNDTCNSFVVKKMLTASSRSGESTDSRLPITAEILTQLYSTVTISFPDEFSRMLTWAMYLLAFNGFLRIGEISPDSYKKSDKVLQFRDITLIREVDGSEVLQIAIRFCKGNVSKKPFHLTIQKNDQVHLCAVTAFKGYRSYRGTEAGPLFVNSDNRAVLRHQFNARLKFHLNVSGFDTNIYKGHSFRIGAATNAHKNGFDDPTIMKMGRWKSSAMLRYIRMPRYSVGKKR